MFGFCPALHASDHGVALVMCFGALVCSQAGGPTVIKQFAWLNSGKVRASAFWPRLGSLLGYISQMSALVTRLCCGQPRPAPATASAYRIVLRLQTGKPQAKGLKSLWSYNCAKACTNFSPGGPITCQQQVRHRLYIHSKHCFSADVSAYHLLSTMCD